MPVHAHNYHAEPPINPPEPPDGDRCERNWIRRFCISRIGSLECELAELNGFADDLKWLAGLRDRLVAGMED